MVVVLSVGNGHYPKQRARVLILRYAQNDNAGLIRLDFPHRFWTPSPNDETEGVKRLACVFPTLKGQCVGSTDWLLYDSAGTGGICSFI